MMKHFFCSSLLAEWTLKAREPWTFHDSIGEKA